MSKQDEKSNSNVSSMPVDVLYHLGISTETTDMKKDFGDVKYVITGGSASRIEKIANILRDAFQIELPAGTGLINISSATDRFVMYKVGPFLCVSHGMGVPSLSIMLHEVAKLINHAGAEDVRFVRLGTCGGLGLPPGSVVVTTNCMDSAFNPYYQLNVLGQCVTRPAELDCEMVNGLLCTAESMNLDYVVTSGVTMCANDFYEEQGRLDGAICEYTEEDKMSFLCKAYQMGVRNIEMESLGFAAFCQRLNIKGAVICVTLLNRLESDQVSTPAEIMHAWQERPLEILIEYIRNTMCS